MHIRPLLQNRSILLILLLVLFQFITLVYSFSPKYLPSLSFLFRLNQSVIDKSIITSDIERKMDLIDKRDGVSFPWFAAIESKKGVDLVNAREWQDIAWRNKEGGYKGQDFIHGPAAAVRIYDYVLVQEEAFDELGIDKEAMNMTDGYPMLVGAVHFTERAESHRGFCHGGSFCAVADDAIGWMGFCQSGKVENWSGFTAQINTSLKKPVKVGSVLKVEAWVNRKEGSRKYWITSKLTHPETNEVYYIAEGLFIRSQSQDTS